MSRRRRPALPYIRDYELNVCPSCLYRCLHTNRSDEEGPTKLFPRLGLQQSTTMQATCTTAVIRHPNVSPESTAMFSRLSERTHDYISIPIPIGHLDLEWYTGCTAKRSGVTHRLLF